MVLDIKKLIKENKRLKEKKAKKVDKDVLSKLSKKISSKSVLKKEQRATIQVSDRKVDNVFEDENRFFKGNFEKEKRSMFLS